MFWRVFCPGLSWSFLALIFPALYLSCPTMDLKAIESSNHRLKSWKPIKLAKPFVLIWVTVAVMKHYDQSNLGRKEFFLAHIFFFLSLFIIKKIQDRKLEAGTNADAMEKCCFLACSSWLIQSVFLQNWGWLVQEWHHPQWTGTSFINQQLRSALHATYSLVLWRLFHNWCSLLSDDCSLCQVVIKLASISYFPYIVSLRYLSQRQKTD